MDPKEKNDFHCNQLCDPKGDEVFCIIPVQMTTWAMSIGHGSRDQIRHRSLSISPASPFAKSALRMPFEWNPLLVA